MTTTGSAGRHRLLDDERAGLPAAREDEDVGSPEPVAHVGAGPHEPDDRALPLQLAYAVRLLLESRAQPLVAGADDDPGRGDAGEPGGLHERREVLLRGDARDGEHERPVGPDAGSGEQGTPLGRGERLGPQEVDDGRRGRRGPARSGAPPSETARSTRSALAPVTRSARRSDHSSRRRATAAPARAGADRAVGGRSLWRDTTRRGRGRARATATAATTAAWWPCACTTSTVPASRMMRCQSTRPRGARAPPWTGHSRCASGQPKVCAVASAVTISTSWPRSRSPATRVSTCAPTPPVDRPSTMRTLM